MAQTSGVFGALSDQVLKVIEDFTREGLQENEATHKKLFKNVSTTHKFIRKQSLAPFGAMPAKGEGEEYSFDQIMPGYSKDFTPREYGMGFQYTETAQEDDDYDVLAQHSRYLGLSARILQETQAAAVLNNGFSSQTTADGVALFSTAHTLKRGGTARNKPTVDADLSTSLLDTLRADMRTNTKLESGQLMRPARDFFLVVHPDNEGLALRICRSEKLQGTADNDINHLKGGTMNLTPLVWEYIADADAVYLIAKKTSAHGLIQVDRVKPRLNPPRQDPKTGNWIVSIRLRQVWDSFDWRNVAATQGA